MTLGEGFATLLEGQANIDGRPSSSRSIVSLKLALVGLAGFKKYYPAEISGGMKKRAGLARAMALDPRDPFLRRTLRGTRPYQRPPAR